jgi:hypothetical protein
MTRTPLSESTLRARARRQGLVLRKSRTRTPQHIDYGTYSLVDPNGNWLVAGDQNTGFGLTLDDIEAALNE